MARGFQVWDAAGNLIVDTNAALGVILGVHTFTKSAGAGSLTDANLALGTPFYTLISFTGTFLPSISISGTTISWSYDSFVATYEPGATTYTILYGYR